LTGLPETFCSAIEAGEELFILEEHVQAGGLGMQIFYALAMKGLYPKRVTHRHALGYPSGRYGSQTFHRKECGLDLEAIRELVRIEG
jgi:transketolase